jgi:hypothetical protein
MSNTVVDQQSFLQDEDIAVPYSETLKVAGELFTISLTYGPSGGVHLHAEHNRHWCGYGYMLDEGESKAAALDKGRHYALSQEAYIRHTKESNRLERAG